MLQLIKNSKFYNTSVYYLYDTETQQRTLTCTKLISTLKYFLLNSTNIPINPQDRNSRDLKIVKEFLTESEVIKYHDSKFLSSRI